MAREPVGLTRVALHSYFSLLGPDALLDVMADAKRAEARRLLPGRPEADLPILCTAAPFKAGGRAGSGNYVDIPPGPMAFRQAADLYNSPNTFCLLEATGLILRDWLERSAALFRTLNLGRPARTNAVRRVVHPEGAPVRDLCHQRWPVGDDDRFVLATSSYRLAQGGGGAGGARAPQ